MTKVTAIALIVFALCSCRKKDTQFTEINGIGVPTPTYDTIKPLSYYPVYPGSYWKYLKNNSVIVTDCTSVNYVLHSFYDQYPSSVTKPTKPAYVPFLNKEPVYKYNRLSYFPPPFGGYYRVYQFLSETIGVGFSYTAWTDPRYNPPTTTEVQKVTDKFIKGGKDSVLVVRGSFTYTNKYKWGTYQPDSNLVTYREYTKNVGLTFHCIYDTIKYDTTFKLQLIEYHIGLH